VPEYLDFLGPRPPGRLALLIAVALVQAGLLKTGALAVPPQTLTTAVEAGMEPLKPLRETGGAISDTACIPLTPKSKVNPDVLSSLNQVQARTPGAKVLSNWGDVLGYALTVRHGNCWFGSMHITTSIDTDTSIPMYVPASVVFRSSTCTWPEPNLWACQDRYPLPR
jgi:hypothetical protein